jgi:hypothetical protein
MSAEPERAHVDEDWAEDDSFHPKTELGRLFWESRRKVLASGQPLLNWDDIDRLLSRNRGEDESEGP